MLRHYPKKGQVNRVPEVLNIGNKSPYQPESPTEKYSGGWFHGLIGENPMYPENSEYWSGYSLGYREFWCKQKGVALSDRF